MGIERARVVEVHAGTSATGHVGSGYLVSDRLVLSCAGLAGRDGAAVIRPAGTATWISSSLVWRARAAGAALLEVDDPAEVMMPPGSMCWGEVTGRQPVAVTAMGFPPAGARPQGFRDPQQFIGHLLPDGVSDDGTWMPLRAHAGAGAAGEGMTGAALFAGAELVGVVLPGSERRGAGGHRAVPAQALARDAGFVDLAGHGRGLALVRVRTTSSGFPIL